MIESEGKGVKIGALDRYFPPVWLFVCGVILVVLLTVISGWKIFNLENERNQIIQDRNEVVLERRLLERDLQAHSEIRKQLPILENSLQVLTGKVADLEGEVKTATAIKEGMQTQALAAEENLAKAKSQKIQDEAAASSARKELANLNREIQSARSQSQNLEKTVETLIEQEKTIRKNIESLKDRESSLHADINGLEKEKSYNKKMLEQMSLETGELQKLYVKFETIAEKLENSRKSTDEAVKNIKTQSDSFGGTVAGIEKQTILLSQQTDIVKNSTENLKSSSEATLQATMKIKKSFEGLDETTQIFERTAKDTEVSNKNLISKAGQSSEKLQQQTDKLGKIIENITEASIKIFKQIDELDSQVSTFDQNLVKVSKATSDYSDTALKSEDFIAGLTVTQNKLSNEVEVLKQITSAATTQLNGQNGTLKQLLELVDKRLQSISDRIGSFSKEIEGIRLNENNDTTTDKLKQ